jgi:Arm DNA-binding domain
MRFTKTSVAALAAPVKGREEIADEEVPGLRVRVTETGARSWSVFRRVKNGFPVRVTIGDAYVITPTVAREQARAIIMQLALGNTPVRKPSIKAQNEANKSRKAHTLEALAFAYADYLQQRGRSSHTDARSIFTLHLVQRAPQLANAVASEVASEAVGDLLRLIREAGKGRTANKLRSYLSAAYTVAERARTDHTVPVAFKSFAIYSNPVAATKPDAEANKADKNPLRLHELRAYWRVIESLPGRDGAMLRVHLLTGGQRIEQLIRLSKADIEEGAIALWDAKGRKREPRKHVVPLLPRAVADIALLATGDVVFSRGGAAPIDPTALTRLASRHVGEAIEAFTLKRVRSGVETLLAQRGVNEEIRGRLQSHGVSGVQSRHYNAHDYFPEKLKALQLLESVLHETDAKVIGIRKA